MKLIVKTLSGKQLPVEIEADKTIRELKEAIEANHQMKADTLKLIAYGKVLDKDDNKCSDHNLKENDYIVAMQQTKKVAPKKNPPVEAAKPEDVKMDEPVPQPVSQAQPAQAQAQPAAQAQPVPVPQAQPEAVALTPEQEASVTELLAISGKPRELVIQALQAANNIPDVAFEFLMSGYIPQPGAGGGGGGAQDDYGDEDPSQDGGDGGLAQYNLDGPTQAAIQALVNNPSFPMIRQRMIQDPQFSAQFMQQLQQTQPAIFNAIQQNPGILMSLILGHDPMSGMGGGGGMGGGMPPGGMGGGGGGQPPPGTIQVSPEEMEAITRLTQLGFPKNRAAEAYFACDKNEEMAANFLFESGGEDEDTAMNQAIEASQQPAQPLGDAANPNPPAEGGNPQPDAAANNNNQPPADNNDKKDEPDAGAGAGGGEGSSLL